MTGPTTPEPPLRPCFGCQVFDRDPRHEIVDPTSGATVGIMHMDCCAEHNSCVICKRVLGEAYRLAGEGATGEDLRAALIELPPMQVQHEDASVHGSVSAEVQRG